MVTAANIVSNERIKDNGRLIEDLEDGMVRGELSGGSGKREGKGKEKGKREGQRQMSGSLRVRARELPDSLSRKMRGHTGSRWIDVAILSMSGERIPFFAIF